MRNCTCINIPVTNGVVKATLKRMFEDEKAQGRHRPDLTMHHLRMTGKVEIRPGQFFLCRLTGHCRFIIESGPIDPDSVPAEIRTPALDDAGNIARIEPVSAGEAEEVTIARLRKRLLAVA